MTATQLFESQQVRSEWDAAQTFAALHSLDDESLAMMKLFEETAFARDVLGHPNEDCWNKL